MTRRIRVAVIGGGQNCEHDVGRASAAAIAAALDHARYEIVSLTIERDGQWRGPDDALLPGGVADAALVLSGCEVVFPAVHGPLGEDGTLAALCGLLAVPCVGSGLRAGALAMDKWATKLVASSLGIPTARSVVLSAVDDYVSLDLIPSPRRPVIVKPVAAGSSHGVRRVYEPSLMPQAIECALGLSDRVLVEEFVMGREIDIAVLELADGGRMVGPPLEIVLRPGKIFDTDSKYSGQTAFSIASDLAPNQLQQLEWAARSMFETLGCSGVARVDFFLTTGGLVLNEVNTMPGLTEQSQVPRMFAEIGMPYPDLLAVLITGALSRRRQAERPVLQAL